MTDAMTTGVSVEKYRCLYLSTVRDHVREMERLLSRFAVETRDQETLEALYQHAHSMKGMSAMMEDADANALSIRLERTLGELQKERTPATDEVMARVHRGVAGLRLHLNTLARSDRPVGTRPRRTVGKDESRD